MTLLAIQNLTIRFGDSAVVDDVSLTVAKGEVLALVGESGSGKSLTAQAILRLLPGNAALQGDITLDDTCLSALSDVEITRLRGRAVGMIFQEPMTALNPLHPIARQMIEAYCWHRRVAPKSAEAKAKLQELFAAVGLTHLAQRGTLYPHQLSGGERQRVMIAMAIANDPALLIADEPTTALDVTLQQQILQLLKSLQQSRGMGMLFITHDLLTVQKIADRVAVMQAGKIVETGTVREVFAAPQHAYTKMLLAAAPAGAPAPLPTNAPEIIACENLRVDFAVKSPLLRRTLRTVAAIQQVNIRLHAGETLGVIGESGSGKTSLGLALLRLIKSEGPIVFLGTRLDTQTGRRLRARRADMQIVFQDPFGSLNPRMSVGEIIAEGLKLHWKTMNFDGAVRSGSEPRAAGVSAESTKGARPLSINDFIARQVDEILAQVGLTPAMKHRYPHEFSGGQRQRIAIARAMILKPKLVVLDEPTSALDLSVQRQVLELLKALQASHQVAYVFISHDLRTVRAMAHQVLVLRRGAVVESGPAGHVFTHPQHDYTRSLLAATP